MLVYIETDLGSLQWSSMELSVAIINEWKAVTIVSKSSIVDVSEVLDPLLTCITFTAYHNNRLLSLCKDYFPV